MAKKYCVIIGDIVQSKEIKNRKAFQRKFHSVLEEINKNFTSNIIISRFTVTIGDEFQGVLKSFGPSYEIIDAIQEMLYPEKLRFGVGWGEITTQIKKEAIGMDGPAFHNAREAILTAEKKGRSDIFKLGIPEKELAINTLALCLENIRDSWTARQREVLGLYRKYKNQRKVARLLKIKQPSVAAILASSKWDWYAGVENSLNTLLKFI